MLTRSKRLLQKCRSSDALIERTTTTSTSSSSSSTTTTTTTTTRTTVNNNKRRRHSSEDAQVLSVVRRTRRWKQHNDKENRETALDDDDDDDDDNEEIEGSPSVIRESEDDEVENNEEQDEEEGEEVEVEEEEEELEENDDAKDEMRLMLKRVYSVFNRHSEIYFGVDKDIGDLPKKRVRKASNRITDVLPSAAERVVLGRSNNLSNSNNSSNGDASSDGKRTTKKKNNDNLCSAGYGEVTRGSFSKVLKLMQTKVPSELRLDRDSTFLDIGSGFGKCVVHAKVMGNVSRSVGLEYVKKRHEVATEAFKWLKQHNKQKMKNNNSNSKHQQQPSPPPPLLDLSGIELRNEDATKKRKGFNKFSHIYCFDYVFSQDTREKLAKLLAKTNFKLLACCTNPKRISAAGCPNLQLLHKFSIRTTGNQNFTMYLYRKSPLPSSSSSSSSSSSLPLGPQI
eukprot:TRINITY_DN2071_c0_g1_i2.p1 TRINITY_DN2071_c0_g1~~TRINITY_DN2071_c0_g1_i2.p1  ORF type:complete len:453 (-),score=156.52 TRINITY_DN2071_c0_g1_i2:39-1397(-)